MATQILYSDLDSWLQAQPDNTSDTPYEIEITGTPPESWFGTSDTTDTIGYILKTNQGEYSSRKFVSLTFADSVFSVMEKLTDATEMFKECEALVYIDISSLSNLIIANSMFMRCSYLKEIKVPKYMSDLADADSLFESCSSLKLIRYSRLAPYSQLPDMQSVRTAQYMFSGCPALGKLEIYDFFELENASHMFAGCWNLELDDDALATLENVVDASSMFWRCYKLTEFNLHPFKSLEKAADMFYECTGLTYLYDSTERTAQTLTDASSMFKGCTGLTSITMRDFTRVSDASYLFSGCTALETADISNMGADAPGIKTTNIFSGCKKLRTVNISGMSTVTSTQAWFSNCTELEEVSMGGMSSLKSAQSMFSGCTSLKDAEQSVTNRSIFDESTLSNLQNGQRMFSGCTEFYPAPYEPIHAPSLTNAKEMFSGCTSMVSPPDLSGMTSVTDTSSMFSGCTLLTDMVELTGLSKVTKAESMFEGCTRLTGVDSLSDMTSLSKCSHMFAGCHNIRGDSLSGLSALTHLTDISYMFYDCTYLGAVELEGVTADNADHMFEGCTALKSVRIGTDVSLTVCDMMFKDCTGLRDVYIESPFSPVSCVNLFMRCESLTGIDLGNLVGVSSMEGVFSGCTNLREIHGWGIPTTADMTDCFSGCTSLEHIYIPGRICDDTDYHAWLLEKDTAGARTLVTVFGTDGGASSAEVASDGDYTYSVEGKVDELYSGNISASDIKKMLATRYPLTSDKDAVDPSKDGFILRAREGSFVSSNICTDTVAPGNALPVTSDAVFNYISGDTNKRFITESVTLSPTSDMRLFVQGEDVTVTLADGAISEGTLVDVYALTECEAVYYAGTEESEEGTVSVTENVPLVRGSRITIGYVGGKWQVIGTYGAVWN